MPNHVLLYIVAVQNRLPTILQGPERRIRDSTDLRLIIDLQKLLMQLVPLQLATPSLNKRSHIADPSATGDHFSIQGPIGNILAGPRRQK